MLLPLLFVYIVVVVDFVIVHAVVIMVLSLSTVPVHASLVLAFLFVTAP